MKEFHKYLRDIRKANNELLKDMADKFGIGSNELFAIEQGKIPIPENLMKKIRILYPTNEFGQILLTRKFDQRAIVIDIAKIEFLKPRLFECEVYLVDGVNVMVLEDDTTIKKIIQETIR